MAIEDAIVLAKCLRDCAEVSTALATYERLRRRRVERVVAYSAQSARARRSARSDGGFAIWPMPLALGLFASPNAQAWVYRYHIDWREPVVQPR